MLFDLCLQCKHKHDCYQSKENYSNLIDECPVRQLAADILSDSNLYGEEYYRFEDRIVNVYKQNTGLDGENNDIKTMVTS